MTLVALGWQLSQNAPGTSFCRLRTLERQDRRPNLSLVQGSMRKKALKTASKTRRALLGVPIQCFSLTMTMLNYGMDTAKL